MYLSITNEYKITFLLFIYTFSLNLWNSFLNKIHNGYNGTLDIQNIYK